MNSERMKKYDVIYADPPWQYNVQAIVRADNIEEHYPTMNLEDIKNMKIPAKTNCILWLWATSPKLKDALEVMSSWGFQYITCAVWDKGRPGLGHWFRQQHELLLVGRKGDFKRPPRDKTLSSVFYCKRGKHSEKPFQIRDYLADLYKGLDKIELFARTNDYLFKEELQQEWDLMGNDI